jgi:hypothetical protein
MHSQDRQAIDGLFSRLGEAERHAGPRDPGADAYIRDHVGRQPNAPYFMAQTIVVQEQALEQAQRRIEELERRAPAGGGLLSGLFGGGQRQPPARQPDVRGAMPMAPQMAPGQQGGGFLAGAAQTAMGVAGGVLLGNMIGGMFGSSEAKAAEPTAADDAAEDEEGGGFFDGMFGGDEEH